MSTTNAPGTPGAADQGTAQAAGEGLPDSFPSSTETKTEGTDETLFSEEETNGLPEDAKRRVDGMVANYKRRMNEVASLRKTTEAQLAQIQDQMRLLQSSETAEPASPSAPSKSKIDALLDRVSPTERPFLQSLVDAVREDVQANMAPIASAVTATQQQSELASVRTRYPDFDQIVTRGRLQELLARYPTIQSYDVAYRALKFEPLTSEHNRIRQERDRLLEDQKKRAATERPSGPSADRLASTSYLRMPKDQRRKLNIHELAAIAEKEMRGEA